MWSSIEGDAQGKRLCLSCQTLNGLLPGPRSVRANFRLGSPATDVAQQSTGHKRTVATVGFRACQLAAGHLRSVATASLQVAFDLGIPAVADEPPPAPQPSRISATHTLLTSHA